MSNFVTRKEGQSPLIICVPHGGNLDETYIPDRKSGVFVNDDRTKELAHKLSSRLAALGRAPYFVCLDLPRIKVDVNRPKADAESDLAVEVWEEYHGAISNFVAECRQKYGRVMLLDLHGHSHSDSRIELGYGLSKSELGLLMDSAPSRQSDLDFKDFVFGPHSLGSVLTSAGYPATPRPGVVPAEEERYFNGGFTIRKYEDWPAVRAIQMELNMTGIRDNNRNVATFAAKIAPVLVEYLNR